MRSARRLLIALTLALGVVAGAAITAYAQGKCPADVAAWQNMYDTERVRHGDAMTALENAKDQIQTEQQVALTNCRNDKGCIQRVRDTYRTLENSFHRQEERTLGQVKRDCKLYDKMDQRTKTQ